jgi:hypothetical protein
MPNSLMIAPTSRSECFVSSPRAESRNRPSTRPPPQTLVCRAECGLPGRRFPKRPPRSHSRLPHMRGFRALSIFDTTRAPVSGSPLVWGQKFVQGFVLRRQNRKHQIARRGLHVHTTRGSSPTLAEVPGPVLSRHCYETPAGARKKEAVGSAVHSRATERFAGHGPLPGKSAADRGQSDS